MSSEYNSYTCRQFVYYYTCRYTRGHASTCTYAVCVRYMCYTNTCHSIPCRPKHPVKVHMWAGISLRGRTGACVFDGIMDASMYVSILRETLVPFLREVYPEGHRFCRTMIPSIRLDLLPSFFMTAVLTGGRYLPRARI